MFEGRAAKVVLISLLSTSEARGINSLLWLGLICVKDVAAGVVHLPALSSAVSLSVNCFFPAYPAERCALNGKVRVVL